MPRYIDADKIIYIWLIDADGKEHDGVTLQSVIDKMPTADVVEVVRCKDCKYRSKKWYEDKRVKDGGYWLFVCENDNIAERVYGLAHDKDYCSYGERAEK